MRFSRTLGEDLARDVGVSPNTSKHWVSLLATSGLITVLEGWSRNATIRLVKAPKVYFNDTGLLCALLGFRNETALKESPLLGAVWETWGLSQIRIWLNNRGRLQQNLFYWRTKDGKEVDFVLEEDGILFGLECKATEPPGKDATTNLGLLRRSLEGAEVRSIVLCRVPEFVARWGHLDVSADNGCHLDQVFV